LFCGFYELLHNKCASYVDAHELIWLYIEHFKFWCYMKKTLIFLLISKQQNNIEGIELTRTVDLWRI
jgi:hypothetical protein